LNTTKNRRAAYLWIVRAIDAHTSREAANGFSRELERIRDAMAAAGAVVDDLEVPQSNPKEKP
jgi:hypothetical protein